MTQDLAQIAPKIVSVLFENDRISVLDFKFKKGDSTPMHSHPPNYVYALKTGRFNTISLDGQLITVEMKQGESSFIDGNTHSVQYLPSGELLQVELK